MRSEILGSRRLATDAHGIVLRAMSVAAFAAAVAACAPPREGAPPAPAALAVPSPEFAPTAPPAAGAFTEVGMASFYGPRWAGRRTASGNRYRPGEMTAAHRTLPFGSMVRVTNLANGYTVIVTINDRGPRDRSRIIDVSRAAADVLDFVSAGVTRVKIEQVTASALQSTAP
jgi:rare lipoprotein A